MSIAPICNKCKKELKRFGGLVFSAPNKNGLVKKYHIYENCFIKVEKFLKKIKRK